MTNCSIRKIIVDPLTGTTKNEQIFFGWSLKKITLKLNDIFVYVTIKNIHWFIIFTFIND